MVCGADTSIACAGVVLVRIHGEHGGICIRLVAHEVAVDDVEISERTHVYHAAHTSEQLVGIVALHIEVGEYLSRGVECLVISLVVGKEGVVGTELVGSHHGTAHAGIVDRDFGAQAVVHLVRTALGTVLLKGILIEVYRTVGAECTAETCRVVDKLAVGHDDGDVAITHGTGDAVVLVDGTLRGSLVVVVTIAVAVYEKSATAIVVVLTQVGGAALLIVHTHTAGHLHAVEDDILSLLVVERTCAVLSDVVIIRPGVVNVTCLIVRLRSLWQHTHHILVGKGLNDMIHTIVLRVFHVTRKDGLVGKLPWLDDVVAVVVVAAAKLIEVADRLLLYLVCAAERYLCVGHGSDILAEIIGVTVRIAVRCEISAVESIAVIRVGGTETAIHAHALGQQETVTRRVAIHSGKVARRIVSALGDEYLERQVVGARLVEGSLCVVIRTLLDDVVDGILQTLHRIGKRRSLLTVVFLHTTRLGISGKRHHGLCGIHVHILWFCHEEAEHELSVTDNLVKRPRSYLDVGAVIGCRHQSVHLHEVGGRESRALHQGGVFIHRHTCAHQHGVVGKSIVAEVAEACEVCRCGLLGERLLVGGILGGEAHAGRVEVTELYVVRTRETEVLCGTVGERIELDGGGSVARSLRGVEESRDVCLRRRTVLPYHGGVHADVDVLVVLTKPDAAALGVGGVVDDGGGVDVRHLLVELRARRCGVDDGSVGELGAVFKHVDGTAIVGSVLVDEATRHEGVVGQRQRTAIGG